MVTALPATGKTTGTVKTARDRPLSYLAPRKESSSRPSKRPSAGALTRACARSFTEEQVEEEVLAAAVLHVRGQGKRRLRDRWAILGAAFDDLEDDEAPDLGDIFEEADEEGGCLERPTCETAEGDHCVA